MNNLLPHYDVIVIGAGSIGTPAAYYLAKSGLKTLVIEKEASTGQGSNKRAIGGIRATHSDPAKIQLCQRSIEVFSTWKEVFGDDIEWVKGGYCYVAYQDREEKILKDLVTKQKTYHLNVDWLDKNDLLKQVPDLNPDGLLGGTYSPDDGNASPLLSNHFYYVHAVEAGAEFHFNETICEIVVESGKIKGIKTSQGEYSTDIVVNAAGPWAKNVASMVEINIPVNPDSHEAAITEPVAHFLNPMIVDIRPTVGSANYYFYQHYTGQIVFCITPDPNIWGFNVQETSSFLPMVSRRMIDIMPCLKNIRVRRTWRGLYPMTPDGFPIIGWAKEVEGFLQAVGMSGQGYMLGPGVAELVSRIANNKLTPQDTEILSYVTPYRNFTGQEMLK